MSNYRPIAVLTSFSKVLEKVICERLRQHINNNNVISEEQCGFWTNSSTDKPSHKLINDILHAVNNKMSVSGKFCDFQKAHDCIRHDILSLKLEFYSIVGRGKAYLWHIFQEILKCQI